MKKFRARQIYLLFMLILGVFLTTGCGGGGGDVTEHWKTGNLLSIAVTPETATIPITGTQQYTATATYSDGSTSDVTASSSWTLNTASFATVSPNSGFATGTATGTSVITASYTTGGITRTATATLIVNAATSVSFVVTPSGVAPDPLVRIPVTATQQYTAIETFSDGGTQDRTAASTWTAVDLVPVSTTPVATIDNTVDSPTRGRATGVNPGTSTITAAYGVYTGTVGLANRTAILTVTAATVLSINVTPVAASIVKGTTQNYQATAILSDGTTSDVTASSTWTATDVGDPSISPVATLGGVSGGFKVVTGSNLGQSDIRAAFGGKTSPALGAILTVIAGALGPGPAGAVDLGTASTYGVMSYSAMTLSAPAKSHIYGDVGILFTSTFTGFAFDRAVPSAASPISIYVTGQTTSGPTSTTGYNSGNFAAMVIAFNDLNAAWIANNPTNKPAPTTAPSGALPTGGTFTAAGQDLTGMLLGPGIYASNTPAGTLALSNASGPLVLDAGGNPDAVFIFQASDITTTSGSVVLRNGAQPNNVYWVLTQTATIGNGTTATTFQGTILAGAAVTVGLDTNVEGRVLAGASLTSGALTINGGVVTVP